MWKQKPHALENAELLSPEALKELRESSRFFLRLDYTYLAAVGALVTALKIGREEIVVLAGGSTLLGFSFIAILFADLALDHFLLREWIGASTKGLKRTKTRVIAAYAGLQPALHLALVSGVLAWGLGYASAATDTRKTILAAIEVQEAVDRFIASTGRTPTSIDEVTISNRRLRSLLERFGKDAVRIESLGQNRYQLIFAGRDGVFGTDDDWRTVSEVKLRKVWDGLQRDKSKETEPR